MEDPTQEGYQTVMNWMDERNRERAGDNFFGNIPFTSPALAGFQRINLTHAGKHSFIDYQREGFLPNCIQKRRWRVATFQRRDTSRGSWCWRSDAESNRNPKPEGFMLHGLNPGEQGIYYPNLCISEFNNICSKAHLYMSLSRIPFSWKVDVGLYVRYCMVQL